MLVARTVSTSALGAFGLAFTTYTITLGATRALCSEPLTVRYSATGEREWREGAAAATGRGAGARRPRRRRLHRCLVPVRRHAAPVADRARREHARPDRPGHLAQRLLLPPARDVRVRERPGLGDRPGGPRGRGARGRPRSSPAFILAWAGAANVAAVFGSVQAGFVPRPQHARRWLLRHRDLGPRYLIEFLARNAAHSGAMYATAGFAGLAAAGALRGAQVVLGPLNILNMGVTSPAIAESVRIARRSPRRMLRGVDDPRGRRWSSSSWPGASPCTCCPTRSARRS